MIRNTLYFIVILLFITTMFNAMEKEYQIKMVEDNTDFALSLFRELCQNEGSVFFSPYSISSALAMTYAGSCGATAEQMANALCFSLSFDKVHASFREINTRLARFTDIELTIANSIFPQIGYPFLNSFQELLKEYYGTEIMPLDFSDPVKATHIINKWVSDHTRKKITDIIPEGSLDPLTVLVLANAIYFRAPWDMKFNENATREDKFYITPTDTLKVNMMSKRGRMSYFEASTFKALNIPYKDRELSMLILLPNEAEDLNKIIEALTSKKLNEIQRSMTSHEIILYLPRFKHTYGITLNDTLQSMGMLDAFNPVKADFGRMYDREKASMENLFINNVRHKAFIEVSEEGTEAAAATTVEIGRTSAPAHISKLFKVDRPFVYFIIDNDTGTILFLSRVDGRSGRGSDFLFN